MRESIVRDSHFIAVGEVRVDSKNRISLPRKSRSKTAPIYKAYANESGQIILDPQVVIPAAEAWLFKNKPALESVRRGLRQAGEGKARSRGSFSKYSDDKLDD